jgi:membrane protease YdiL (CAAX protease family)
VSAPPPEQPASRLRSTGWALLFFGFGALLSVALFYAILRVVVHLGGWGWFGATEIDAALQSPRGLALQTVSVLTGFGVATWLVGFRANHLSFTDLRWKPLSRAGRGWATGLGLGVFAALVTMLLSLPLGGARFLPDQGGLGDYLRQAGLTVLLLAPAALAEEVAFRGVALVLLARVFGRWQAVLALSVLFGCAHLLNPNHTPLAISNIALAGLFLGTVFYMRGGIWAAWGAHLGWNATLALLDAPVSGLPFTIPLINYDPGGPVWLTGGAFGPEGGAIASLAIVVGILVAARWARRETA